MIKFSHSGKIGDMMYALPYLHDVAKAKNDRVELCIIPGHFDTPVHEVFQFMRPLMELFSEWLHFTHSDSVDKSYISLDEFRQVFGEYRMRAGRHLMQLYYLNSSIPLPMPSITELIDKTLYLGDCTMSLPEALHHTILNDKKEVLSESAFIYISERYTSDVTEQEFLRQIEDHEDNKKFDVIDAPNWTYLGLPHEKEFINHKFILANTKIPLLAHRETKDAKELVNLLHLIQFMSKGIFGQGLIYALVQVFAINQKSKGVVFKNPIVLLTEPHHSHLHLPVL